MKLVSLSKFGTSLGQTSSGQSRSGDRAPLLLNSGDGNDPDEPSAKFQALMSEIEALLDRLAQVNELMLDAASSNATRSQSASAHHTLQRHRDILQDYRGEYTKTKSNLISALERHQLMSSVHRDISDYSSGSGSKNRSRMDMLLKENEHARNSERLIDDQINIAIEARDTLVNQRYAFKAVQAKLNDLSSRFPAVNNLVQKINLRKRRDTIILGTVVGLCFTFFLWWMLA